MDGLMDVPLSSTLGQTSWTREGRNPREKGRISAIYGDPYHPCKPGQAQLIGVVRPFCGLTAGHFIIGYNKKWANQRIDPISHEPLQTCHVPEEILKKILPESLKWEDFICVSSFTNEEHSQNSRPTVQFLLSQKKMRGWRGSKVLF